MAGCSAGISAGGPGSSGCLSRGPLGLLRGFQIESKFGTGARLYLGRESRLAVVACRNGLFASFLNEWIRRIPILLDERADGNLVNSRHRAGFPFEVLEDKSAVGIGARGRKAPAGLGAENDFGVGERSPIEGDNSRDGVQFDVAAVSAAGEESNEQPDGQKLRW